MGSYPKITIEQYKYAIECKRIREETPTLGDLEIMWGLTKNTLGDTLRKTIKRYERIMAQERAAKMKEDALQKSRSSQSKAPAVLKKLVRGQQEVSHQPRKETQTRVSKEVARLQVE